MKRTSWFTYFSSAWGTCWLVLMSVALVTQTHINAGAVGLVAFVLIGVVYAWFRRSLDARREEETWVLPMSRRDR